MLNTLRFMLAGGFTKRFHTVPTIREHTVAAHSYGVACICYILANEMPSRPLLMAALTHDMAEQIVGDVPSPTKRAITALKSELDAYEGEVLERYHIKFDLNDEDKRTLKMADIFDGMFNCCVERGLGNRMIAEAFGNFKMYASTMKPKEIELEVFTMLSQLWEKNNG